MRKLFGAALVSAFLFGSLSAGLDIAAGGELYLVEYQDPVFLETLSKISTRAYNRGRTMVVRLSVPYSALPAEIKPRLRPVTMDEVHNAPSGDTLRQGVPAADEVQAILSKVSSVQLKNYAETITYTGKRSAAQLDVQNASGNKRAMDAIADAFRGLGLAVERHCYAGRKYDKECNIIGRRPGPSADAKSLLVIGHMDSVGYADAGADDNASGAAGVLEMARVLGGYSADHAFIFVASNGEENGVDGGNACAEHLGRTGELGRIAWAINMDMIAWNRDGVIEIETNKEFLSHAEWVSSLARTYTKLQPHIASPAWGSDHVPFLKAGIPTYLSIEHWEDKNPCYHKACDKLESLSWDYAAEIIKLNLAVVAGKAKLIPLK